MNGSRTGKGAPSLLHSEVSAHPANFSQVEPVRFRSAPMLFAATCFAAGVCLAHLCWRPAAALVIACAAMLALCVGAVLLVPRLALACTLLTWCVLGCACGTLRPRAVPSRALAKYEDGLRRDVSGRVTRVDWLAATPSGSAADEDPLYPGEGQAETRKAAPPEDVRSVDIALAGVEEVTPDLSRMVRAQGTVRLTIYAPAGTMPAIACGSVVRVTTRLHPPQVFRDPGVWQREQYLADLGVIAVGSASQRDWKMTGPGESTLACQTADTRRWATQRLTSFARWQTSLRLPRFTRLMSEDAGLLDAMLFGDRTYLSRNLRVQFERTGTFHLFVVAGMHVALLAGVVFWILQRLRMPDWTATFVSLCTTAIYAMATGFREPVQRALLMTAVYMAARLLSRERGVLNAAGTAALAMLIVRPQVLFDAGYQMTVLVALAIGGVALPLLGRTISPYARACGKIRLLRLDAHAPPAIAQFRLTLRTTGEFIAAICGQWALVVPAFAASVALRILALTILAIATEVVMAIPMAVWFHRVTPFALPANLLVLPLLPVVMCLAFAAFLLALVSPWLALPFGMATAATLHAVAFTVRCVGSASFADWRIPAPPGPAIALALLIVCLAGLLLRQFGSSRAWAGAALLPLAMAVLLLPYPPSLQIGLLEVTAIDVGQGDSLLVAGPAGKAMLIDAGGHVGPEDAAPRGRFNMGDDVVSPYLWSRGIRTLDVLVLTHAHMDHIGGMEAVLRNFRPRELWLSVEPESKVLRALLAETAAQHVTIRHLHAGDTREWSGTTVRVLGPAADYAPHRLPGNDDSLVLRFDYGAASALLEGDAEHPSEERMLADGRLAPATLLQVGHHGSDTSTGEAFLRAVRPHAAIVSCGRGNRFGHSRMAVLQRLAATPTATFRTDTMGATQFLLRRDGGIAANVLTSNAP